MDIYNLQWHSLWRGQRVTSRERGRERKEQSTLTNDGENAGTARRLKRRSFSGHFTAILARTVQVCDDDIEVAPSSEFCVEFDAIHIISHHVFG